jgi:U3 small nucleolar RNA-associated protein 19
LTAPPAGIIIVIPFIYNLFKRHPGCMVMIQRHEDEAPADDADPYNPEDPSPMTSGAIKSSCWELAMLQTHYLGSVSTLAKVFTEVFTKPEYNMEDFLDHGYDTLFATESNRKIKNPPALSLALESGSDVKPFPAALGDLEGDEVSRLWTF